MNFWTEFAIYNFGSNVKIFQEFLDMCFLLQSKLKQKRVKINKINVLNHVGL
jgi:hypothetical protein